LMGMGFLPNTGSTGRSAYGSAPVSQAVGQHCSNWECFCTN
jgi:hypothetical protein